MSRLLFALFNFLFADRNPFIGVLGRCVNNNPFFLSCLCQVFIVHLLGCLLPFSTSLLFVPQSSVCAYVHLDRLRARLNFIFLGLWFKLSTLCKFFV